jgi:hypothetical protein
MADRSVFSRLCDELSRTLTPRLRELGFAPPPEPFSRDLSKYEFTRPTPDGVQVLEILFNKYRAPLFAVQIYVAPAAGIGALQEHGGTLVIGHVSSSSLKWPFAVRPFRAEPGPLQRLFGAREDFVAHAVESFLWLLPEIETWWQQQRSTAHITVGTLRYPGAKAQAIDYE